MDQAPFEGQQEGERILVELHPHPLRPILKLVIYAVGVMLFVLLILTISSFIPSYGNVMRLGALMVGGLAIFFLLFLHHAWITQTRTYLTDRRIIRFEMLSPVFVSKRSLFWNEVLKTKSYTANLLMRLLKIGSVKIEPHLAEHESIIITDIPYFDDIANYIDKILYVTKNTPGEIPSIKPFVFAPRGKRG